MRLVRKFCHRPALQSESVANQVVAHLSALLTSKAQFSSFNPQFGLTCEVGEQPSNILLEHIAEHIKLQVSRFEQRFYWMRSFGFSKTVSNGSG